MINANFGIKILDNRNLLLTADSKLVHFFSEKKRSSRPLTNVYFYIKDDVICQKNNDVNYVTNLTELSNIPIYRRNHPCCPPKDDDLIVKKLIDESAVCIYYNGCGCNLSFFLHYIYNEHKYYIKIPEKTLALLKYTWFTTQTLSFNDIENIGEKIYSNISNINVYKIFNNLKVISGEVDVYGEYDCFTFLVEKFIIDTDDFYILNLLLNLAEKFKLKHYDKQRYDDYVRVCCTHSKKELSSFDQEIILLEAKLNFINYLIENKKKGYNMKDCIVYDILKQILKFDCHLSYKSVSDNYDGIDTERFESKKTNTIISELINSYNIGKHMAELLNVLHEATKIPDYVIYNTIDIYNNWLLNEIECSDLDRFLLCSPKDICEEFNKRSNERLNFNIDFSLFEKCSNDCGNEVCDSIKTLNLILKEKPKQEFELSAVAVAPTPLVDFSGDDLSLDPRFW